MFSYRHGFHAGNHADVLKHMVVVQLFEHLLQKTNPSGVDTHAGGGLYDLTSGYATKSGESLEGIHALWPFAPRPVPRPSSSLTWTRFRPSTTKTRCTGTPARQQIAAQMMREGDHLRLFELHPSEIKLLEGHFAQCAVASAFNKPTVFWVSGLPAPAPDVAWSTSTHRTKSKTTTVALQTLRESVQRFATGTYAIWYPEVARRESQRSPDNSSGWPPKCPRSTGCTPHCAAKALPAMAWVYLAAACSSSTPWTLYDRLAEALPWLVETIGIDEHAAYTLEAQQS